MFPKSNKKKYYNTVKNTNKHNADYNDVSSNTVLYDDTIHINYFIFNTLDVLPYLNSRINIYMYRIYVYIYIG